MVAVKHAGCSQRDVSKYILKESWVEEKWVVEKNYTRTEMTVAYRGCEAKLIYKFGASEIKTFNILHRKVYPGYVPIFLSHSLC